jgi:hypothetical protein
VDDLVRRNTEISRRGQGIVSQELISLLNPTVPPTPLGFKTDFRQITDYLIPFQLDFLVRERFQDACDVGILHVAEGGGYPPKPAPKSSIAPISFAGT